MVRAHALMRYIQKVLNGRKVLRISARAATAAAAAAATAAATAVRQMSGVAWLGLSEMYLWRT